ncbi:MAG TPA: urease subunit gamma [Nitrososphaera sp.]|jgi:urease gamma subunit
MINIKATVKGEPDTAPFMRIFTYARKSDEQLFYSSVEMIKEKLDKNLKININESLIIYCAYVVSELRTRKTISLIERNAQKILTPHKVMIGVPESLRKITFEANIDKLPKRRLTLKEPITTTNYILAAKNC